MDGDLLGDGVNIAARLESIAAPGAICLSEDAYRQAKSRLDLKVSDLGLIELKNIAEPIRLYSLKVGVPTHTNPQRGLSRAGARSLVVTRHSRVYGIQCLKWCRI